MVRIGACVGVDLGGAKIHVGVVDREGCILASRRAPTGVERGVDAVLDSIGTLAEQCLQEAGVPALGVGVGIAGQVDTSAGIVRSSPNLDGWTDVALARRLAERLHVPIVVANDMRAIAKGEWRFGAGRGVSDLVVLFVGTRARSRRPSAGSMFLREVALAHEVGTPVMVYAVSAGPLFDESLRARVREVLERAAVITVRDRQTRKLFEEIGLDKEVTVTADPALLLQPEPLTLDEILRAEAIDPDARLIGFSVREPGPAAPDLQVEHYHRLVANAADFMIDRLDAEVVFFPLERRTFDVQHSHSVVGQMSHAQRATVLKRDYSPGQVLSLLEHC